MSNFNTAILEGNLTSDPEVSYAASGAAVATFSIAVNRKYKDKESVLFMPCVSFGKLAEILIKYGGKGKKLLVSGYLSDDSYVDRNENTVHRIKLYLDTVRFIGAFTKVESDTVIESPPAIPKDTEPDF